MSIDFVKDRDAALLTLDIKTVNAYLRKYGSPELPDNETGLCAMHKARSAIVNFPADEKQKSKDWLKARGFKHWDDAA